MTFSTEVLPLLYGRDDVRVEVSGRCRTTGSRDRPDRPCHQRTRRQADSFDLGITVTVEGREVPFAELFVALADGQSHLLSLMVPTSPSTSLS